MFSIGLSITRAVRAFVVSVLRDLTDGTNTLTDGTNTLQGF